MFERLNRIWTSLNGINQKSTHATRVGKERNLLVVPTVSKTMSAAKYFTPSTANDPRSAWCDQCCQNTGPFQNRHQSSHPSTANVYQKQGKRSLLKCAGQTVVLSYQPMHHQPANSRLHSRNSFMSTSQPLMCKHAEVRVAKWQEQREAPESNLKKYDFHLGERLPSGDTLPCGAWRTATRVCSGQAATPAAKHSFYVGLPGEQNLYVWRGHNYAISAVL